MVIMRSTMSLPLPCPLSHPTKYIRTPPYLWTLSLLWFQSLALFDVGRVSRHWACPTIGPLTVPCKRLEPIMYLSRSITCIWIIGVCACAEIGRDAIVVIGFLTFNKVYISAVDKGKRLALLAASMKVCLWGFFNVLNPFLSGDIVFEKRFYF